MIIANFATESCRVTDGMICVASDNPYGERDLTSDNDFLPAVTTIWLAAKWATVASSPDLLPTIGILWRRRCTMETTITSREFNRDGRPSVRLNGDRSRSPITGAVRTSC